MKMEGDKETVIIGDGQEGFWKQATVCGLPVLGMQFAALSHSFSTLSTSLFFHFSVFFVVILPLTQNLCPSLILLHFYQVYQSIKHLQSLLMFQSSLLAVFLCCEFYTLLFILSHHAFPLLFPLPSSLFSRKMFTVVEN